MTSTIPNATPESLKETLAVLQHTGNKIISVTVVIEHEPDPVQYDGPQDRYRVRKD